MVESQDLLQHPRRNLGNRYRSTAQKFANLAKKDPARAKENLAWAEQNARQAILHDFTDERNWRCLADLKVLNQDGDGLHAVLEDVFSILGRDPEHLDQLRGIDFLAHALRERREPVRPHRQESLEPIDCGRRKNLCLVCKCYPLEGRQKLFSQAFHQTHV